MKLIDPNGRTFQLGMVGEVPTDNLLWVDPVNGNDALGTRGNMTMPFKTLVAATTRPRQEIPSWFCRVIM